MFRIIYIICVVALLSNCVAVQTFPNAARAGDTITVAIGSIDGLNKSNLSVLFYPDSDPLNPVDITPGVRSVLKIYPDKTSKAYWDTTSGNGLETMTYLSTLSLHGPWESVVVIDLPSTLPPGYGHIKVQFGSGITLPLTLASANNVDISLEILPSLGESNSFEYRKLGFNSETNLGNLGSLEEARQIVLRYLPDFSSGSVNVAAAEYTLTVPVVDQQNIDVTNMLSDGDFAVVLDDQPSYLKNQVNLIWSRNNSVIKVLVLSSTGLQDVNQLRFSILLSNMSLGETNGWVLSNNATLDVVRYYASDGSEVTRPMPQILVRN